MIRPFEPSDYETIKGWMGRRGFPAPPIEFLATGFMVGDFACGFLYEAKQSILGWVEFVCTNPDKSKEERALALDALFFHVEQVAKEKGLGALFSTTNLDHYGSVLKRNGYVMTDQNVTHYVRKF